MVQGGFWDFEERLRRLSDLGDQLEAFTRLIDFEMFRDDLERALARSDRSKGGRPPYDPVLMFKILIIQTIHTLSDERTEYLDTSIYGQRALIWRQDERSGPERGRDWSIWVSNSGE